MPRLPQLVRALSEGRDYLYRKALYDPILEYDRRCGSQVAATVNDAKREALLRELAGFMLTAVHEEMALFYPDSPLPARVTDALYFEMYRCLPPPESDYVRYHNPELEDSRTAPAFKFGQTVAGILGTLDIPFLLMMSQQCPLILEASKKLVRFTLFDEPMERQKTG